jgi:DNA-binding transcriptional regulator YiaG
MTPAELRERREAMHLSQPQLAALLDTSAANVRNWEQGRVGIPGFLHLAIHALETNPPPGYHLPPPAARRGGKAGRPAAP